MGRVAMIRSVDQDLERVTVEYRNGDTGWFTQTPLRPEMEVGTLWPNRSSFVVIVAVLGDALVIEQQGRLRSLAVEEPASFATGSTIEVDNLDQVVRTVADHPLRAFGLGDSDEDPIAGFRRSSTTGGAGFETFGGYREVVDRARELVETPLRWRLELDIIGARPVKGVLFSGPPGTGKTKLASLIANETSASFYEVSGPAIVSKWVGDSERTLQRGALFEMAVELDADETFRLSTTISSLIEILDEDEAELLSLVDRAQLGQVAVFNRILERLLVGLVPIRAKAVDYVVIGDDSARRIVSLAAFDTATPADRATVRPLYIVGFAEQSCFGRTYGLSYSDGIGSYSRGG